MRPIAETDEEPESDSVNESQDMDSQ